MAANDRSFPAGASCCRSRRRFQSDRAAATRAGAAGSGSVSINVPCLSHRRPRRRRHDHWTFQQSRQCKRTTLGTYELPHIVYTIWREELPKTSFSSSPIAEAIKTRTRARARAVQPPPPLGDQSPRTARAASNRTLFSVRLRIRLWMSGSDTAARLHCEQRTRCPRRWSLPALTHACSIRKNEKGGKQQALRPLFVARRLKSSTEIAISVSSLNGCKPDPWPSVVH